MPEGVLIPILPDPEQFFSIPSKLTKSVINITSDKEETTLHIIGTIIEYPKKGENITYIISKSSMVGTNPTVIVDGDNLKAEIVDRSVGEDLVLLKVLKYLPNGIKLTRSQDTIPLTMKDLGRFLVSPLTNNLKRVGDVSSLYISTPIRYSQAYFGANAAYNNQKIIITDVAKRSGSDGIVQIKDQIIKINGVEITKPEQYGAELSRYIAGDIITID